MFYSLYNFSFFNLHFFNLKASMVSWNHIEFRVRYPSLSKEPQVGNYFLRLLLEEDKRMTAAESEASARASTPLGLSRIKNR